MRLIYLKIVCLGCDGVTKVTPIKLQFKCEQCGTVHKRNQYSGAWVEVATPHKHLNQTAIAVDDIKEELVEDHDDSPKNYPKVNKLPIPSRHETRLWSTWKPSNMEGWSTVARRETRRKIL